MRKIAIPMLMLAMSAFAENQVQWLSKVHDFGAFDEDTKKKTAVFKFVNTTDEPVSIVSATATCGCTEPHYSSEPVAVGDTATIEVSYDPSGRPGRFEKQIYVRTSDSYDRTKLLIKGTVIGNPVTITGRYPVSMGPLKLRTGAAMMGKAYAGHDKMYYADGYNMSSDTISPVLVQSPDWIAVESNPAKVAPGEMMSFDITFLGNKCNQWGILTDSLMIAPNPGAEAYPFPVIVIIEEDFSKLTPKQLEDAPVASLPADRIDIGPVALDATAKVTKSMKLTNKGKDALKIRRIYSEDPGVEVSVAVDQIASGKSAEIAVSFDPLVQPTGIINARFTLITNDPANPTQIIRIVGERQ